MAAAKLICTDCNDPDSEARWFSETEGNVCDDCYEKRYWEWEDSVFKEWKETQQKEV